MKELRSRYPRFVGYDPIAGYDRDRTEYDCSADAPPQPLGWIEYTRDSEGKVRHPLPHFAHLRPRMSDDERLPIEVYLHTGRDSLTAKPGETVGLHASAKCGEPLRIRVFREGLRTGTAGSVDSKIDGEMIVDDRCLLENEIADPGWHPVRSGSWWRGAGWPRCGEFVVPEKWRSGVYRLEFSPLSFCSCTDSSTTSTSVPESVPEQSAGDSNLPYCVLLIVRSAVPGSDSKILFKLSTNSYFAYNNWGGHSFYGFHSLPRWGRDSEGVAPPTPGLQSHRVSPYRPGHGYYGGIEGRFLSWERLFLLWAERENYALEFCGDTDVEEPGFLDAYAGVVSVGHDEYYSAKQRAGMEAFADGGGNIAFLSGNLATWQVQGCPARLLTLGIKGQWPRVFVNGTCVMKRCIVSH